MKYLLLFSIVFSIVPVKAQEAQKTTSMHQIFDTIGKTADDIFLFAKSTLEEHLSEEPANLELFLSLPDESIESDNKVEKIGEYLDATPEEVLRAQIEKNPTDEGHVLLNDFFKTAIHKALREKIETFVSAMTSCTFLTPEESKILREAKIFYPENYESSAYTWEPTFKDSNINALVGRLHKVVGLKQNVYCTNWPPIIDDLVAIIDVTYTCHLRHTEERNACFKGSTIKFIGPRFKAYIEPRHNMTVSITFLRLYKMTFKGSAVSYTCHICGGEKIFSAAEKLENILAKSWLGKNWSTEEKDDKQPSLSELNKYFEVDLQGSANDPFISDEFLINSLGTCTDWYKSIDQSVTDFIIPIAEEVPR